MDHPPNVAIHTWPTATLTELTQQLAATSPDLLPSPSIGTRVAFRLLYHDTLGGPQQQQQQKQQQAPSNSNHHHHPRLATQDLGSVVIGSGGPGVGPADDPPDDDSRLTTTSSSDASAKTLADARFVVGDFLSVAILPPDTADGSVQPATAARMGRGYGAGQAALPTGLAPGMMRGYGGAGGGLRSTRAGRGGGGGGGGVGVGYGREGGHAVPPVGEWRRGERLPDVPGPPGRGRGGGGRRRW